ncbi:Sec-independent protein translocase subunit TatA/TatB [Methylocystis sp. JAN1]|uniref:Sec-independent protein translocase subunit TatA/TatB n=1 Tax=Methylocystis sp. JAN1 TaxID=3397211 RepID=UPI003FA2DC73
MFDLDPGKLIVIGIVALIAIPSKDLPRVLRTLGQATGRMRRMAAEFQGQFMEAMREAELVDLKKEIEETNRAIMASAKLDGSFDPLTEARKQIAGAIEGEPKAEKPAEAAKDDDPDDVMAAFGAAPPPEPPPSEAGEAKEQAEKPKE